jgi:hypothetical protein
MSSFQLLLSSNAFDARELADLLVQEVILPDDGSLELQDSQTSQRSPDQTVLVAIVAGTSAAVSALFAGLLRLVETRFNRTAKIVLRGSDGTTVEVPVGTTKEELEQLVTIAKRLTGPEVRLILPPETIGRTVKQ